MRGPDVETRFHRRLAFRFPAQTDFQGNQGTPEMAGRGLGKNEGHCPDRGTEMGNRHLVRHQKGHLHPSHQGRDP